MIPGVICALFVLAWGSYAVARYLDRTKLGRFQVTSVTHTDDVCTVHLLHVADADADDEANVRSGAMTLVVPHGVHGDLFALGCHINVVVTQAD